MAGSGYCGLYVLLTVKMNVLYSSNHSGIRVSSLKDADVLEIGNK